MNRNLLAAYLFQKGDLPLDGIGVLRMNTNLPAYDVTTNSILSPQYALELDTAGELSRQPLLRFISHEIAITEEEAFGAYSGFIKRMKDEIHDSNSYTWKGLGVFKKGDPIAFDADKIDYLLAEPITAHRIMTQQKKETNEVPKELSASTVAAVETEEPVAYVDPFATAEKRETWWIGALILFLAGSLLVVMRHMGIW